MRPKKKVRQSGSLDEIVTFRSANAGGGISEDSWSSEGHDSWGRVEDLGDDVGDEDEGPRGRRRVIRITCRANIPRAEVGNSVTWKPRRVAMAEAKTYEIVSREEDGVDGIYCTLTAEHVQNSASAEVLP